MHEREPAKETIGRGELLFLSHPGTAVFSGYGLTMQPGTEELLVGLLMVDRPHPADPEWLVEVEATFGECELIAMTPTGERGIACQMQIEPESLPRLRRFSGEKAAAIQTALQPLLVNAPKPVFTLRWDEESRNWRSEFATMDKLPAERSDGSLRTSATDAWRRRRTSGWSTSATRPIAILRALPTSLSLTSGNSSRCPPLR